MNIGLVADELTRSGLGMACKVVHLGSMSWRWRLPFARPDFLLVESAWQGYCDAWKYKIAAYPDYPSRTNKDLARLVAYVRDRGIPTVFWNKEDGVHFERFIDSAKLFDHIFTVDENCIPRYKAVMGENASVHTLMFAVQPKTHSFTGFNFKYSRANFVGSYSHHVHDRRRQWQDLLFSAASDSGLGLTVVDRNSARTSANYRYPNLPNMAVLPAVSHSETAQLYRDYLVSLNVNTIEDSATMFSRRLVEILACGGIAVTNSSPAVDALFKEFCHVVHHADEARELFSRLKHGPSKQDLERAEAGALYVAKNHAWSHRLDEICQVIGIGR
ncbi:CgeB family protein [Vogesella indigofera]|uniref:CgeB family protein n=1 Tax=Vogesella indigofera TaxID=45465 RepID=UPI00234E4BD7|nr:glycosyltransferase [Vogesella indigofera]MDC7710844.1 glycosyltransferase [Vogesella indigofera]